MALRDKIAHFLGVPREKLPLAEGKNLDGKTALLINGDERLGYEISRSLAQSGAHMIVHCNKDDSKIKQEIIDMRTGENQRIVSYIASLDSHAKVKGLIEHAKNVLTTIDILIFNAVPKKSNSLMSITVEELDRDIDEDLTTLFYCTKERSKIMVSQKRGKIIPVFFGVGARGDGNMTSWSTCTGGISGFIKCLAMEFLRYGINVNGVAYGLTDGVEFPLMTRRILRQYLETLKVPRSGRPEEIAGAVNYLASGEADYITGQILYINGGLLI